MSTNSSVDADHALSILVISVRGFRFQAANCCIYEFEDLLADSESIQFHFPGDEYAFPFDSARKVYRTAKYLGCSDRCAANLAPFPQDLVLDREYDLLFAVFDNPWQMHLLESIQGWRDKCRQKACFIAEMWEPDLRNWRLIKEPWDNFDHVFLGVTRCIEGLRELINPPVTYIPPAVDTLRFSPYPNPPERLIDVSYVGRRSPIIHDALIKKAEETNLFYYYDTVKGKLQIGNPREHRLLLANIFKRSRYNITNYAKFDEAQETGGNQEIGYRFFEGAAAGAVMIGMPPAGDAFPRYFDWEDAVVKVNLSAADVIETITELDAQPERLERIRRNNIANSLLKHDWAYRWRDMLAALDLKPSPAMINREKYLQKLADSILQELKL